ncbi:hypothetical protein [Aquibacillus rhizosphaerae]|uniref:Uncharacterized protein n=1 Tax=Aquibacillus rhizosphaerae TaxID=3051431 RepID=A0ABT7L930_9BACI|nr:hypothetical protein [Aquibacillus sp. LR5S19]MDL4842381.1 hypothetical protein [Aquibacillus sp. LR5S19]
MTMRLEIPLFMFILFLVTGLQYSEFFEPLGWWQYLIAPLPMMLLVWLLFDKLNLKEKRVDNGVGVLIILSGATIWIILEVFI